MFRKLLRNSSMGMAFFGLAISATAANAATFDFLSIADGGSYTNTSAVTTTGYEETWTRVIGSGVGIVDDGISVVGTGVNSDGGFADAYFDSGHAGLGVCSQSGVGACIGSNDDNVGGIGGTGQSGTETLILSFSTKVLLDEVLFRGEGHGTFGGTLEIDVDGGGFSTVDPVNQASNSIFESLLQGTVFSFKYIPRTGSGNEFYIESVTVTAVPVPAAAWLLLSALGGLGFAGWRRNRSAAA
jgi:hypothetical protein